MKRKPLFSKKIYIYVTVLSFPPSTFDKSWTNAVENFSLKKIEASLSKAREDYGREVGCEVTWWKSLHYKIGHGVDVRALTFGSGAGEGGGDELF